MRKYLLASACVFAAAFATTSALAEGLAFTGDGTFGNIAGAPSWSFDGAVNAPLDWENLSVEGNVGDRGVGPIHLFDGGGSIVWSDPQFRIAGNVLYNRFTASGTSIDTTQMGAGGEWYFSDQITASVNGGANVGLLHGGYIGGKLKFYVTPDLALDGFVEYNDLAHKNTGTLINETDYGAHAEWMPWEEIPVSLNANYTRAHLATGSSADTDIWWIGLKLYLNDSPATTLVERQRTGTLDTIAPKLHLLGTN